MPVRVSILFRGWWLRIGYPDTGLYRWGTLTWDFKGRPQRRTQWIKTNIL